MSIRRDARNGSWFFRKVVRLPDGRRERIFGVPQTFGLPQTKQGAQEAERREVERVMGTGVVKVVPVEKKEVPTVAVFSEKMLEVSRLANKPAEVYHKELTLKNHILPAMGKLRLDEVTYAVVEDFKLAQVAKGLSKKSVNNHVGTLRRLLSIAKKRGEIASIPPIETLKAPPPPFDFLTYEEADKLIAAMTDGVWKAMITVAVRTGLRQSELRALRWEDVDLNGGKLLVSRSEWNGVFTLPKSGKPREVPLSDQALTALKRLPKHGPFVFCYENGRMFRRNQVKGPLWRACKLAGLRPIQWHVLRHTFASHLAMRGAPLKVVQELLGHATIQMTMRYAHLYPAVAREHVKLLDGPAAPRGTQMAAA